MTGKIFRIDNLKSSRNKNQNFQRVHFTVLKTDGTTEYYHTDLVPSFRNYGRWRAFLRVGFVLSGLEKKSDGKINADSFPVMVAEPEWVSSRVVPVETKRLF